VNKITPADLHAPEEVIARARRFKPRNTATPIAPGVSKPSSSKPPARIEDITK